MEKPQAGEYYYHFKHKDDYENWAYKIIGTGVHSETEEICVIYKPLYKNSWNEEKGADFMIRPLSMFIDTVERDGQTFKRFTQITDESIIQKLKQIKSNSNL